MNNLEVEILLVEDNMNDAEMTMMALTRNNVTNKIVHLKNGALALDFIFGKGELQGRDTSRKPKVILLHLTLPKVDGMEVLQQIKSNESTRMIPVVVLTSSKEDPDIKRCYALGVNSYIVKPVDFEGFQKSVADLGFYWMLLN